MSVCDVTRRREEGGGRKGEGGRGREEGGRRKGKEEGGRRKGKRKETLGYICMYYLSENI